MLNVTDAGGDPFPGVPTSATQSASGSRKIQIR